MDNEKIISAVPTGFLYGLYGAIVMVLFCALSMLFGGAGITDCTIGLTGLFCIPIFSLVYAVRHHRDILQEGYITTFKVFTISMLINFVLGIVAGCFMYIFVIYIDTNYTTALYETTIKLYRTMPFPPNFIDQEMERIKESCTSFGIFRNSVNTHLMVGAIIGVITGLIMKKNRIK